MSSSVVTHGSKKEAIRDRESGEVQDRVDNEDHSNVEARPVRSQLTTTNKLSTRSRLRQKRRPPQPDEISPTTGTNPSSLFDVPSSPSPAQKKIRLNRKQTKKKTYSRKDKANRADAIQLDSTDSEPEIYVKNIGGHEPGDTLKGTNDLAQRTPVQRSPETESSSADRTGRQDVSHSVNADDEGVCEAAVDRSMEAHMRSQLANETLALLSTETAPLTDAAIITVLCMLNPGANACQILGCDLVDVKIEQPFTRAKCIDGYRPGRPVVIPLHAGDDWLFAWTDPTKHYVHIYDPMQDPTRCDTWGNAACMALRHLVGESWLLGEITGAIQRDNSNRDIRALVHVLCIMHEKEVLSDINCRLWRAFFYELIAGEQQRWSDTTISNDVLHEGENEPLTNEAAEHLTEQLCSIQADLKQLEYMTDFTKTAMGSKTKERKSVNELIGHLGSVHELLGALAVSTGFTSSVEDQISQIRSRLEEHMYSPDALKPASLKLQAAMAAEKRHYGQVRSRLIDWRSGATPVMEKVDAVLNHVMT